MTVDSEGGHSKDDARRKKRRRYIPHLAEFYFKPTYDWSIEDARKLFEETPPLLGPYEIDRVYYENCISGLKRLPARSIDLVIADPPFGIDFDGKSGAYNRDESLVISGYYEVSEAYEEFTQEWLHEVSRVLTQTGSAYVFSGWTNLEAVLRGARLANLHLLNHIIWHYSFGVYTRRKFVTSHYHALLLVKDQNDYMFNKIENYPQDVWILNRQYHQGRQKNGTKLPIELVQRCIDYSSKPGDVVLDPFMGNGTTAVVAIGSWRHFLGFEINPQMRRVIDTELSNVVPGLFYTPYTERLPTIEELAERYPRAYKEYLRREGLDCDDGGIKRGR